ncbi:hypothetical protein O166_14985 [Pseudogulbenkiania ferrooxidans EGD-HP2]|uniref:Uncharacterized protein n=1 Tax=Pseudogulbenkiania ferrooxidans EGD-HP2 TaxID=1388764 RepID=A0ABP2XHH2_9NEIS|nr:hypothetical protein O166_14985 [Pseudogulbenkiania ferrooxidans EGD-HP2]
MMFFMAGLPAEQVRELSRQLPDTRRRPQQRDETPSSKPSPGSCRN